MKIKRFGNVEIRYFVGNSSVYVMYKEHKFFVSKKDVEDFILAMSEIEKEENNNAFAANQEFCDSAWINALDASHRCD